MKQKDKIKDTAYDLNNGFWAEIFTTTVKDWLQLLPESLASPSSETKNSTAMTIAEPTEKNMEAAKAFVNQFRLRTPADRLTALEALFDEGFPRFENSFIGKILWPDRTHVAAGTLKSNGSRLYRELREKIGKAW